MAASPTTSAPARGSHRALGIVLAIVSGLAAAAGLAVVVRRAQRAVVAERHYQDWRQRRNGWHVAVNGASRNSSHHAKTPSVAPGTRRATRPGPGAPDLS